METLNGDFGEYINNADKRVIKFIQCCCDMFRKRDYKTTNRGRKYQLQFLNPIKKEYKKVLNPDVPIMEVRKVLSKP